MNRRVKIGIMIALLVLAVGFAAITTTLIINGTLSIGPDTEGFDRDVIFTKAKTNGKAFITENGKTIQFTADLQDIGQEVDLRYEITNKNRQYDASGTIECGFVDEENRLNEYITVTPNPDEFSIEASRKKTGHVIVRMIKSFIGSDTSDDDNDPSNIGEIEFKCTIKLEAGERDNLAPEVVPVYTDATLNGADPTVGGDLIPIVLSNDGKVSYADLYEDWYDYSNQRWANAVLLKDGQSYKYDEGDIIKEEDIEAFFVWIPRYRYKLWNVDGTSVNETTPDGTIAKSIEIVFETKEVEPSIGTQNGEWLTHPAFTSFDVDGIWVGKYETSVKSATAYNSGTYLNGTKPEEIGIKPMGWSWRNNKVGGMFKSAYQYNRTLDSHMMKNTEWGAVAYLSHSIYGINNEVRTNNLTLGSAGYAATAEATCVNSKQRCNTWTNKVDLSNAYNTSIGYLASTTGNITGVYDMSGGLEEYVAAYVDGGTMNNLAISATDLEETYAKYFDVYPANSTATSYENRILGDATGEMGPFYSYTDDDSQNRTHNNWYSDYATFVDATNSWFIRGGGAQSGTLSGQFAFRSGNGANSSGIDFRVVLAPQ